MSERVLIIVAHSDDESISMGGTICRHVAKGDDVKVVSMTDGVGARDNSAAPIAADRSIAAKRASRVLGFEWLAAFDFPDNSMDSIPLLRVVRAIEDIKKAYDPTMVYTHSAADLNIDHQVVANAVLTAFRPQPDESCEEIRLFEVSSATDFGNAAITGSFTPNLYVDITQVWHLKYKALEAYATEMRPSPHSRSINGIKHLANLRGHQAGFEFAEAFQVIRKLEG